MDALEIVGDPPDTRLATNRLGERLHVAAGLRGRRRQPGADEAGRDAEMQSLVNGSAVVGWPPSGGVPI